MTLYELVNNTTIQGNVDITYFEGNGNEQGDMTFSYVEDLSGHLGELPEGWEDCEVRFIWPAADGWLHIEIYAEEEEDYD